MRKFVPIHQLELPISKDPFWIFKLTNDWCEYGENNNIFLFKQLDDKNLDVKRIELINFAWKDHLQWLKDRLPLVKSRQVFCHNDMQFSNVFIRTDIDGNLQEKLFIIDYENCSYGFRGYDLAFFLLQKSVHFHKENFIDGIFWPDRARRRQLLKHYHDEYVAHHSDYDPVIDSVDHLLMEVDFFILLMQLMRISYVFKKASKIMGRCFVSI